MMATFDPVRMNEKVDLEVQLSERDGAAFTVTSATITVLTSAGVAVRDAVSASVDDTNKRAYYTETFSTANGYAADGTYTVVFAVTLTQSGSTRIVRPAGSLHVKGANAL